MCGDEDARLQDVYERGGTALIWDMRVTIDSQNVGFVPRKKSSSIGINTVRGTVGHFPQIHTMYICEYKLTHFYVYLKSLAYRKMCEFVPQYHNTNKTAKYSRHFRGTACTTHYHSPTNTKRGEYYAITRLPT